MGPMTKNGPRWPHSDQALLCSSESHSPHLKTEVTTVPPQDSLEGGGCKAPGPELGLLGEGSRAPVALRPLSPLGAPVVSTEVTSGLETCPGPQLREEETCARPLSRWPLLSLTWAPDGRHVLPHTRNTSGIPQRKAEHSIPSFWIRQRKRFFH